jgi:heat shock protein HslJ
MNVEKKRTLWAMLLLLIVVFLVFLLYRVSPHRNLPVKISIDNPEGTYIGFLPSASGGGRTIILQLNGNTQKTAVFTQSYNNSQPAITKSGTWERSGEKNIVVVLPSEKLTFIVSDTKIILDNPVESGYGEEGLELGVSTLPFPSQWKWVDTRLPGDVVRAPEVGESFIMTLTPDLKVSVSGDCNVLMGTFSLYSDSDASFSVNASTRMMCPKSLEGTFMSDVNRTTAYQVDGDMLVLSLEGDIQGYGTMTFIRIISVEDSQNNTDKDSVVLDIPSGTIPDGGQPPLPAPQPAPEPQPTPQPQPMPESTYTLVSYNGKALDSNAYTFTLGSDTIGARFCNIMGGSYQVTNSVISAPQMISTMMFCEQPEGLMDMETTFTVMLSSGAQMTIDGNMLTLTDGKTTFVYVMQSLETKPR